MAERLTALFHALAPLWEMSLTAAYAAAVVAVLRLVLKSRAPRQVVCLLWLVVFARLLLPLSLESPLSIVPDAPPARLSQSLSAPQAGAVPNQGVPQSHDPIQAPAPVQQNGGAAAPVLPDSANPGPVLAVPDGVTPAAPAPEAPAQFPWPALLAGVWLAGAAAMGGCGLVSYLRLRRRLFNAIRASDGAWEHPCVASPFILGMLRPKIYLPAGLYGQPRQFILCHERAHLKRLDHIVKPVCWAALALHWFNPAVWCAFLLMSRDIEAACDEAVVRALGSEVKADYSDTLLALASGRRLPAPCPLAFGEGDAKGRIRNVLRYRRPSLWIAVVSAVMALMAAVCLLTDPVEAAPTQDDDAAEPSPFVSQSVSSPEPAASQAPAAPTARFPALEPWMEELLAGERAFRSPAHDGRQFTLEQLHAFFYGEEPLPQFTFDHNRLAVLDLDGDGADELVLCPAGDLGPCLILRLQGGEVSGYDPGEYAIGGLRTDGTFHYIGGDDGWGVCSARFDDGVFGVKFLTRCDNSGDKPACYVDGAAVTEEEFSSANAAQTAKPEPVWCRWFADTGLLPVVDVVEDQSTFTPLFLGDGMRTLYRQASYFYYHLFGESTSEICALGFDSSPYPASYDPTDTVERDGLTYIRAVGRFARWSELMTAADGLFTRDFWDACNQWDGHALFINVDGDTYFLPVSRVKGDYFTANVTPFTPAGETEDSVAVTLAAHYSTPRAGEDEVAWGQRVSRSYDYAVDYPIRLVKTENGWRFSEFHYPRTDQREYTMGHILWQTEPLNALNGVMDDAALRQLGPDVYLDWDGVTYPLEPEVNNDTFTGRMYVLDVDGDGQTEASLVYLNGEGSPTIAVYERAGGRLSRIIFDTGTLVDAFNNFVTVEQNRPESLTITHRGPREVTSIDLYDASFDGEWVDGLRAEIDPHFFYVGLNSEAPFAPPFAATSFVYLTDGEGHGLTFVASMSFTVEFGGNNSLVPGRLSMEPYPEFAAPDS